MSLNPKKKVILHIGFAKCASTSLQKNLILRHPLIFPILHVGKSIKDKNIEKWKYFFDEIVNKKNLNIIKTYKEDILNLKTSKKIIFISDERIVSYVAPTSFTKFFPKSTILVLIREPVSYCESFYAQYLKGFAGKYKKIMNPDKWVKRFFSKSGNDYEKLYKIVNKLKSWKIKVIPFELLINDQQRFCKELSSILNINNKEIQKYFFTSIQNKRINRYSMISKKIQIFNPRLHKIIIGQNLSGFRMFAKKLVPDKRIEINFKLETINFIKKKTNKFCKKIDNICNSSLDKFGYY